MTTVEELIVKAEPSGLEETSQGFENMQDDLEDVEEQMGETTDGLTDMQSKWAGAMTAIVGGLATAAAGLLTQVPVIGEAASGLGAVIDAVAFKMDEVLRPVFEPLTNELFGLSEMIFEAEGAFGALAGVAGVVVSALGIVAGGAASVGLAMGGLSGAASAVVTVLGAVASAVLFVGSTLLSLPVIIGALIGAIGAFAAAYILNWGNVRDKTNRIISDMKSGFDELANAIITRFKRKVNDNIKLVTQAAKLIADRIATGVNKVIDDAKQWGKDLINEFVEGIKKNTKKVRNAVDGVAEEVRKKLEFNSPPDEGPLSNLTGEGLVETYSTGITSNIGRVASASEDVASAADPDGFAAGRTIETRLFVDGREVNRGTERFRDDETSRRGAF